MQLPRAVRWKQNPVDLGASECAERLRTYSALDAEAAGALLTAARLYQDALWMGEVAPHFAWLLLVSAVETVAHHWRRRNRDHVERLTDAKAGVVKVLRKRGGDELVREVARQIADVTGATLKFTGSSSHSTPAPRRTSDCSR